jgi:hypothetical protein
MVKLYAGIESADDASLVAVVAPHPLFPEIAILGDTQNAFLLRSPLEAGYELEAAKINVLLGNQPLLEPDFVADHL